MIYLIFKVTFNQNKEGTVQWNVNDLPYVTVHLHEEGTVQWKLNDLPYETIKGRYRPMGQ